MTWIPLADDGQLVEIKELSKTRPQLIFKHSTRCSISSMAKSRLERSESPATIDFYFLDLIKHRNLSDKIALEFNIQHESPQVLLIKDRNCIYDESHNSITMDDIAAGALHS